MTLFPLIRGKVEITATRVELYKYLKETCEEDLHLLHANVTPWWGKAEWYNYGFEWYDDSFMVWKVPSNRPNSGFIFTTLNVNLKETREGLSLSWHVRYNLWTNLVALTFSVLTAYYVYQVIFQDIEPESWTFLLLVGLYVFTIVNFNVDARDGIHFIEKIKKRFANNR